MKTKRFVGCRVIIEPDLYRVSSDSDERHVERCKAAAQYMVKDIKRHIDGVVNVYYEIETEDVCSFCGRDPEEDKTTGEPVCCGNAQREWEDKNDHQSRDCEATQVH